jgi:hypothetical protein
MFSPAALFLAPYGDAEWTYYDRSIDTLVARLRKKLACGSDRPPLIRSVRAIGYVFCATVSGYASGDNLPPLAAASATIDACGSGRSFASAPRQKSGDGRATPFHFPR